MNILFVSHEYPPIGGGGANACLFLAKEFVKQGNVVTIVTCFFDGLKEYEEIENGKIVIIRLKSKRKNKEHCSFLEMFDYVIKSLIRCNKLCKENKYDICQVFFGIPSGPIGYYINKKYNIPYVIRFGGGDIPGFQNRFALIYKLIGPFLKIIWKNSAALVANSEGLKKFASSFCDKYNIEVINNGVDIEYFYPNKNKKYDSNTYNLLFVSRLIKRKGLQDLIPDLKLIEKETNKKIMLTIVGDGPYRKELQKLVYDNSLEDSVVFIGQKDKNELLEYYQNGDIFVFPSKREGMPNAVLEAMACGLPIAISKCEGSTELISDNGLIINSNFSKGIIELINAGNENLLQMAINSRNIAKNKFSWSKAATNYLDLFDRILNEKQ